MTVRTDRPAVELETTAGVHSLVMDGCHARFEAEAVHLDTVLRVLSEIGVRSLTSTAPTLEDIFLRYYAEADMPAEVTS